MIRLGHRLLRNPGAHRPPNSRVRGRLRGCPSWRARAGLEANFGGCSADVLRSLTARPQNVHGGGAPSRSLSELRASCEVLMNGLDHY
jgi:hypothetical protein